MIDTDILTITRRAYGNGYVPVFCQLTGADEEEVHDYLDREQEIYNQEKKHYYEYELPNVRRLVRAMKHEVPETERRNMKVRYLKQLLSRAKEENDTQKAKNILREIDVIRGRTRGITDEDIEYAQNFPIASIIGTNQKLVRCPFHDDRTPSMSVDKNLFYCHACHVGGTAIDFVMHRDDISFPQAVRKITCYN